MIIESEPYADAFTTAIIIVLGFKLDFKKFKLCPKLFKLISTIVS